MTTRHTLPLSLIRTDGGTQMRAGLDPQTVAEYSTDMLDGWGSFPPVVTYYDGADYWLADGFHRIAACRQAPVDPDGPVPSVPAIIVPGTRRDAILHAAGANASHGLRRTNADKRSAVLALLNDVEWCRWSDREIARKCSVTNTFVSSVRNELSVNGLQIAERTVTRNGVTYTQNTANIGGKSPADNTDSAGESPARCIRCKRPLSDPISIAAGIGPCCRSTGNADTDADTDAEQNETDTNLPHVARSTGNNEWYTPPVYIAAACDVLGAIDLDPASSDVANQTVGAATYYTAENDGLAQHWFGRVWLNPPYSADLVGAFIGKLAEHIAAGDVSEAIVLVNNATETAWFRTLITVSTAAVFPTSRVRFWNVGGSGSAPLQGQAILYCGNNPQRFLSRFHNFGWGATIESH